MPTIARIRFANVVYENRQKRYNDETFKFDGHNGAILLENGGGKTVFVQTLLQAVIPHLSLAGRKIKDTLVLAQSSAHIAVEWILHEHPRVYGLTVITLFLKNDELHSYKYTYRYTADDKHGIDQLPFTVRDALGRQRPATAEEMHDYYIKMNERSVSAKLFTDISDYTKYLETNFKIVNEEWSSLATINSGEGDVAKFFEACKTTNDLVNKLLIPTVLLAMNSEDKASFTKMFEEKRTNLKKSKQLKRQINENQAVEAEISKMMSIYESQHIQQASHFILQQQGKTFYEEARKNQDQLASQLLDLEANKKSLEREKQVLYEQIESVVIADRRQQEEEALEAYNGKQVEYQNGYDKLAGLTEEKDRLDYLRDQQERDSKAAQLKEEEEKLSSQEQAQQDSELIAKLADVHCQLRGIYDHKEGLHRQALQDLTAQLQSLQEQMQQQDKLLQKQDDLSQDYQRQQVRHQTVIDLLKEDQEKIALQILSNINNQQVGTELAQWKLEAEYVQNSLAEQMKKYHQTEKNQQEIQQQVLSLSAEESITGLELEKVENRIDENRRRHQSMLGKLHEISGLRTIESIYIEKGKIDAAVGILHDRRHKELETAREQERRDFKLVDAYGGQEKFVFDGYLVSFLAACQCVVESGTAYTERLIAQRYATREELLERFPLWPMCLIVQDGDKAELERGLQKAKGLLTSPVFILTTTEARSIVSGTYSYSTVWPEFWPIVLEENSFAEWKDIFNQKASDSLENRKMKELLYQEVQILYRNLDEFLTEYPYTMYQQCQQDKVVLRDKSDEIKRRITAATKVQQEAAKTLRICQETIANLEGKSNDLNRKIEKAMEWQQKEQASLLEKKALGQCQQDMIILVAKLGKLREQKKIMIDTNQQLTEKMSSRQNEINKLHGEELYHDLQQYAPTASLLTEQQLKANRLRLKEELAHINSSREVILNRIKIYQEELERFNRRLQRYRVQVPEEKFPVDGDIQLENLQRDIYHLQPLVKKQQEILSQARYRWETARTRREEREKFYLEKISADIHEFTELLSIVKERLTANQLRVEQELIVVGKNYCTLQQQLEEWRKLCDEMERHNGKLEFLADSIPVQPLVGEQIHSFPYQSSEMVHDLLEALQKSYEQLERRKSEVEKTKSNFETFCQSKNFQNEKMRQNLLSGIRQRHRYQEMLAWGKELKHSIQTANTVAEHNMQAYNEDVKHFINQLHLHLVSICDEILIIQRMTGVKVEEHYKTIYEIKTPVWEEHTAKEKLMEHLEWMTEQLAGDTYKQEDGLEDSEKIRKNIERWLSPSYLFTRISPNKGFTVGVRKVSNDNRISNYPVDWATSNSWSGGEKWSKNMALFLGIQNYLSEKRQPIIAGKGNIRTVVLDNPFGQASSDHVLEPVFFIAEKLGFQVIALTALAEGKFLRDYFPIIYSCRLRSAEGGETTIMDKELYINHAFFQDNAPQSLGRIGQVTQIELLS